MPPTAAEILERIIEAEAAKLPREAARYLQSLDLPQKDRQRLEDLIAREATLTPAEQTELDHYWHVTRILERLSSRARDVLSGGVSPSLRPQPSQEPLDVSSGIRRSQEAFWRDLPQLLENKRNVGKWVCYHGDERIGIAESPAPLIRECQRRGFRRDQYDLDLIESRELPPWEPEEVEDLAAWHREDVPPSA